MKRIGQLISPVETTGKIKMEIVNKCFEDATPNVSDEYLAGASFAIKFLSDFGLVAFDKIEMAEGSLRFTGAMQNVTPDTKIEAGYVARPLHPRN